MRADPAPFDLAGPVIEMQVTRGTATLPAAHVPALAAGDRLWLKADLPQQQAAHYLMVAVFLRGSTNPPPADWFIRCDTWAGKCAKEGMTITVPKDAQQLLLFLAPETGGDFKTLMNAVRGRPGTFVRTSQDLNQATLDRSRLESYVKAVRSLGEDDPERLKEAAPLLARSLAIKVDEKCLDKMSVLQAPCLMQGRESMILNDGHSASIAQALTSGPASDLAMEASSTAQLKYGYYGPYIGSIFDIARILDSIHTAQYQYIPALASASGSHLALTLNAPPSFHDPKSVLVIALPAIENAQLPPLHAVDPKALLCARRVPLVLPVDGAPLVFSTGYAHGLVLHLSSADGKSIDLPVMPAAERGGFVADAGALSNLTLKDTTRAVLQGFWGFDRYEGPGFTLADTRQQSWQLAAGDDAAVIVGRQDTIHVHAGIVNCVESLYLRDTAGKETRLEWKSVKPDELEVRLPLQDAAAGELTLLVRQYGQPQPQSLALHAFAEAGKLESFTLHAGDTQGILRGNRLDEVDKLTLKGVEFEPGTLSTSDGRDELAMVQASAQPAVTVKQGEATKARVALKDGRAFEVRVAIDAPRPSASLIGKNAQSGAAAGTIHIHLANADEVPHDAQLTFSLRAQSPPTFTREEKVEVMAADGAATVLDSSAGAVTLQNSKVAVVTLNPARSLGSSGFGPLKYRLISEGVAGDWRALAVLVRVPLLKSLDCPQAADGPCVLTGVNLFLLDSISASADFSQPVKIPDGFPGQSLQVPRPLAGQLFVKLRDDPGVVSVAALDGQPGSVAEQPPITPTPGRDAPGRAAPQ